MFTETPFPTCSQWCRLRLILLCFLGAGALCARSSAQDEAQRVDENQAQKDRNENAMAAPTLEKASVPVEGGREPVAIGFLAFRGEGAARAQFGPTVEYLSEQIDGYDFVLVPMMSHAEAEKLVQTGSVAFVATHPGHYALLEHRYGLTRMATMRNQTPHGPVSRFGAVILTRKGSRIKTLEDLRGKRFMAVEPHGFGGFLMAKRVLLEAGIDIENEIQLEFCGFPQDQVPIAVRDGKVDAGTVRTHVLERMAAAGKIDLRDFEIVNQQDDDFPYAHSTPLYPEWAFAVNRGVDQDLSQRVAIALLSMPQDHPAALAARNAGWTVPLDYGPVHNLLRDLREPPYQHIDQVTAAAVFREYWYAIVLALLGLAAMASTTVYVVRLNRKIQGANSQLAAEMEHRRVMQHQLLASEKMASLGQLAAGVAHEINSPLAFVYSNLGTLRRSLPKLIELIGAYEAQLLADSDAIRAEVERLRDESGIDYLQDDAEDLVQECLDGLRRMRNIVSDMKSFSHVGDDDWQVVDLRVGMKSTINIVRRTKKTHGQMVLELGDIPKIDCLASQLNQVFMNLILNAYDAIDDKGTITVRTRPYDEGHICVEVSDTGPGIDDAALKRIFDPFYTTKAVGQGTGLGLAISLRIVHAHSGRIEVDTKHGQGTTFRVVLPLRPNRQQASSPPLRLSEHPRAISLS